MATSYTYSITTDFLSATQVDPGALQTLIAANGAIGVIPSYIDMYGDTVIIYFPSALTVPQKAALDLEINNYIYVAPPPVGSAVSTTEVQTLINKTLTAPILTAVPTLSLDDTNSIFNLLLASTSGITVSDKKLTFNVGNGDRTITLSGNFTMTGAFPLTLNQTASTAVTLPTSGTLATIANAETFTSKTLISNTNTIISRALWTGSGASSVSTFAAAAPTTGQVLTATSGTLATWQTPAAAGEVNTASSAGGTSIFKQKTGVDLIFKGLTASSPKIVLTSNTNDVGINVDETKITAIGSCTVGSTSAIAHVASTATNNIVNSSTFTINVPAGTLRDMMMIAQFTIRLPGTNFSTITPPDGWQQLAELRIQADVINSTTMFVYSKMATVSEPASYTWTGFLGSGSNFFAGGMSTYSGVSSYNILKNFEATETASATLTFTTPSVTTTVSNSMLIAFYTYRSATTLPWTLNNGQTQAFQSGSAAPGTNIAQSCVSAYILQPVAGNSGTFSATAVDNADLGSAFLIALNPSINNITPSALGELSVGSSNTTNVNIGTQNCNTNAFNLSAISGYPATPAARFAASTSQSADIIEVRDAKTVFEGKGIDNPGSTILSGINKRGLVSNIGQVSWSVDPFTEGFASQTGTTITGVATTWDTSMVGGIIVFANGKRATIAAFISASSLTALQSQTVPTGRYAIYSNGGKLYSTGTATQSGNGISGFGTTWTPAMVGGLIVFADGKQTLIVSFVNGTTLVAAQSQPVFQQEYDLYYGAAQQDVFGNSSLTSLNISSLTTSQAVVTDPSKNLVSLAYTPLSTASTIMSRDFDSNTMCNNITRQYNTTVSSASPILVAAASAYYQYITGSTSGIIRLPSVFSVTTGYEVVIVNVSSADQTIQTSTAILINILLAAGPSGPKQITLRCINTSSNAASSWSFILSGPPGGSNTQLQYNNGSSFEGASVTVEGADKSLVLPDLFSAAAPAAGLKLFSKLRASKSILTTKATYAETAIQSTLATGKIAYTIAGNGTVLSSLGLSATTTGTLTARTVATGSLFAATRRLGFVTAAVAGGNSGLRHNLAQYFRSSSTLFGGFYFVCRFGMSSAAAVATQRSFVGMLASVALIGNIDPSSAVGTLGGVGFGVDSADSTWTFMHSAVASAATKDTLTGTFPPRDLSVSLFEARIHMIPNSSTVFYSLEVLGGGSLFEGSTSTNIPAANVLMAPQIWTNTGTTALAAGIDIVSMYMETD